MKTTALILVAALALIVMAVRPLLAAFRPLLDALGGCGPC